MSLKLFSVKTSFFKKNKFLFFFIMFFNFILYSLLLSRRVIDFLSPFSITRASQIPFISWRSCREAYLISDLVVRFSSFVFITFEECVFNTPFHKIENKTKTKE